MAKCIITGCDLVDQQGFRWCHGDLHLVGSTYVFNACLTPKGETAWQEGTEPQLNTYITVVNYFERRGVLVIEPGDGLLSAEALEYVRSGRRTAELKAWKGE
jgi:hypothetical protein